MFQSTPSAREGDFHAAKHTTDTVVSIHAFREGRRHNALADKHILAMFQSTPSAREGDRGQQCGVKCWLRFQSTPSAREGDRDVWMYEIENYVSIHAFREGRRPSRHVKLYSLLKVSIHAFREGRRPRQPQPQRQGSLFQSTPSAREGDLSTLHVA